jgi:UDP-MurNAc hydroxylase
MKLTFITNACAIYEHDNFWLMTDPWLVPGAFGTWIHDPPIVSKPEDFKNVDALYISHIHPDHLCEKTLEVFRRDIPIITLKDKLSLAERKLKELGFTDIRAMEDRERGKIGPFDVTMFGPFTKHPFHADACEIGNVVDSSLLVAAGGASVLNTNDNTPSFEAAEWLAKEYGPFDIAQLNWNNAGPYPACFDNLTDDEKRAEAKRCLDRNLYHMAAVARRLKPKVVMPFAGAYKLGYGKEHLNEFLGTCSAVEAAMYLVKNDIMAFCLDEGKNIDLCR